MCLIIFIKIISMNYAMQNIILYYKYYDTVAYTENCIF